MICNHCEIYKIAIVYTYYAMEKEYQVLKQNFILQE